MERGDREAREPDLKSVRSASKGWTTIQHSSGLVAAIGLFLVISAYSTDPDSGLFLLGLWITFAGLIGFAAGWSARRRHR